MRTRWTGLALILGGLLAVGPAKAQMLLNQAPRTPMPEPIPAAPSALGAGGPMAGPYGAPGPGYGPGAPFPLDDCCKDDDCNPCKAFHQACGCYLGIGALGLQRQGLGNSVVAVFDPGPSIIDTGTGAPGNTGIALNYDTIEPNMSWGVRATLGYRVEDFAVELSGFYLPENEAQASVFSPGQVNTVFVNAPAGFFGNQGLFLQADLARATLRTALGSAEVMCRFMAPEQPGLQLLLGLRYLDLQERMRVLVVDDGGATTPVASANYTSRTFNKVVAPQVGLECDKCLCGYLAVGASAKAAFGANFIKSDADLQRGDSLLGFSNESARTEFTQLYELGFYLDIHCFDRTRLRAGYTTLWVVGVAEAVDQIDFNLANTQPLKRDDGSIFYHGPLIEFQLLF